MANDSTATGYLSPVSAPLADDIDLDVLIQPVIVGITGLPDARVVIKGQPVPPPQPDRPLTWCAFAVISTTSDINASVVHDGAADAGQGQDRQARGEVHEIIASFYGPAARSAAALLRDGIGVSQNRATLRANGLAYVGMDRVTFVPDLENTQFVRRVDLVFRVRRMAIRTYDIRNVASIQGQVIVDSGDAAGLATVTSDINAGP